MAAGVAAALATGAVLRGLAAAAPGLAVARRDLAAVAVSATACTGVATAGARSSSATADLRAVLWLDEKSCGESFAARRPGAGGRGIVDEPFLNKIQKAQSRLETEAAVVGENRKNV